MSITATIMADEECDDHFFHARECRDFERMTERSRSCSLRRRQSAGSARCGVSVIECY